MSLICNKQLIMHYFIKEYLIKIFYTLKRLN